MTNSKKEGKNKVRNSHRQIASQKGRDKVGDSKWQIARQKGRIKNRNNKWQIVRQQKGCIKLGRASGNSKLEEMMHKLYSFVRLLN